MAKTTSAPFKSGTVASVSGATLTASSAVFDSGDAGRCLRITSGAAAGQIRRIISVASATTITADYAWDASPFAADGFSEVAPSSPDGFVISYFLADLADGAQLVQDDNDHFRWAGTGEWTLSGAAFVYDRNTGFEFDSNAISLGTDCAMRFGDIAAGGYASNGCLLIDFGSGTSGGFSSGGAAGDVHLHGCLIECRNAIFWRLYRGAAQTARFTDCIFSGDMGGRIQGANSIVRNCQFVGGRTTTGIFNPKSPFGLIKNIVVNDCDQFLYHWWAESLSVLVTGFAFNDILIRGVRLSGFNSGANPEMLEIADIDIDKVAALSPFLVQEDGVTPQHIVRVSNFLDVEVRDLNLALVPGYTMEIRDNASVLAHSETSPGGAFSRQRLRHADISMDATPRNLADGVVFAPYTIELRKYDKIAQTRSWDAKRGLALTIVDLDDQTISEPNRSIVDAYAEISDLSRLRDRWKSETVRDFAFADLSAQGSVLDIGAFNLVVDPQAAQAFSVDQGTITIDPGAGILAKTAKFDRIVTTGSVTFANGASTDAIITDASGTLSSLTLTGLQPGSEIRIFNAGTSTEIGGVEASGTSFAFNYTHLADFDVDIAILSLGFLNQRIAGVTLTSAPQTIPVRQIIDRQYENT